jgi:hypothetical protein
VLRDEHGIGGGSEYCGYNDAQLGRISALSRGLGLQEFTTRGAL